MSPWPSRDPDDYTRGTRGIDQDRAEPPFVPTLGASCASAGLVVAATMILVDAKDFDRLLWVFVGAVWVARSRYTHWWQAKNEPSSPGWMPTALFTVLVLIGGFVAAANVDQDHPERAIFVSLVIAWFGGDALHWLLRRRWSRGSVQSTT